MPQDSFTNARPYFDVTVPSSGDGFSIANFRNAFGGLGFMDFIPLQPRARNPADTKIMVRGRDASSFYNPIYASDSNSMIPFGSGDSPAFSGPSGNPRIDIVYLTPSGDIRIQQGSEAASPTLPSLAPSGDTRLPICAVYNKVGQTRIVNFESKDSSTGDGYIYQDLRPFICFPKPRNSSKIIKLADATTLVPNLDEGNIFDVTIGGNRSLAAPSGKIIDGKKWELRIHQDGTGGRSLGLNSSYASGDDVTSTILSTSANKVDRLGFEYNSSDGKHHVIAVARGY